MLLYDKGPSVKGFRAKLTDIGGKGFTQIGQKYEGVPFKISLSGSYKISGETGFLQKLIGKTGSFPFLSGGTSLSF